MPTKLDRPIRVVMFGSGPYITRDARKFLVRLESDPDIDLLGAFCQSEAQSTRAVFSDLVQRRGVLAVPLMAAYLWDRVQPYLFQPFRERAFRRTFSRLSERVHFVRDIHAPVVLEVIRTLAPDLGLIYGSPILRPELFELPNSGTLGIHHGKVPEYRGNKTTFWAMLNGEPFAGVTIQKINAGLDTGEIVNEGQVPIGKRTHRAVWMDLEALGLDLYLQSIREVKNGEARYRPQRGKKGPLYRNPKPNDYVRFWRKRLAGLFRLAA